MPCTRFLGGMVCTRGRRGKTKPCFVRDCRRPGYVLCDWIIQRPGPGRRGVTCSRLCCRDHARHVDTDKDLCLEHFIKSKQQKDITW